ncbi:sensor histidine kinase [Guptibacillus spartinae]|uniref:sensor histidine kinase n=1 Tax=Guptibacillus spartinae TaxID=3025679 RepID=UPI00236041B7|nr:HAMP domain-containing sensor histidine kinase [Pseudalkalibacillus spartinae]
MRRRQSQSLLKQFTAWYVWQFIIALIIIGLVVLGSIGYFLLEATRDEVEVIEEQLVNATDESDVQKALEEVLYPDNTDYDVEIRQGGRILAQVGEEEELDSNDELIVPMFDQYIWNKEEGLFYKQETPFSSGVIHMKVPLEDELEFLQLIFTVLLVTGLVSILLGSILIYQFTKKRLRPLLKITSEVGRMKGSSDLQKRIAEPDNPKELKELASTFNQLLQQVEEQFEREKRFVSNASHELRTPLTAFRGHLNLIKRWGKDDPAVLESSLQALDDESSRMKHILEQMLTIARNEHQKTTLEKMDLTEVVDHVVSQFESRLHVPITAKLEQIKVSGDREQLRQVVVILLENAQRYTMEGSITVDLKEIEDKVTLSISDTGIGIPRNELPKIFSRFYRVDKNRSRETGGTGLGLSIAKEIVENHHGTIEVASEEGIGSTFTVSLPAILSES